MSRKRAAGQSSIIFNKSDRRWHGYVTVGTKPDGSLDRRHVAAKAQADCVSKMQALEVARASGTVPKAGKGTTVTSGSSTGA